LPFLIIFKHHKHLARGQGEFIILLRLNELMFIALEGIDGSGKSTMARMLASELRSSGSDVFLTHEPTPLLELPADLISRRDSEAAVDLFFRFTADRYRHQFEIEDALREGKIVISDRYLLSSLAYQGPLLEGIFHDSRKAVDWMMSVSEIIRVRPDVNIYIDITADTAIKRIWRRKNITGFEDLEYLERVRTYYLGILFQYLRIVPGSGNKEETLAGILEVIRQL